MSKQHSEPEVPGWVREVSPRDAYLAGFDDGIDSMGNELARERSRPGGSFDQWADYQRLEEQLEAEKQRLNTFELRTEEFLDSQGYSPMEVDELLVSFHVSFPALRPSE